MTRYTWQDGENSVLMFFTGILSYELLCWYAFEEPLKPSFGEGLSFGIAFFLISLLFGTVLSYVFKLYDTLFKSSKETNPEHIILDIEESETQNPMKKGSKSIRLGLNLAVILFILLVIDILLIS